MEFNESLLKLVHFLKYSLLIYKVFIQSTPKKKKTIHVIDPLFPITFPSLQRSLTCYIAKEKENLLIQYIFNDFCMISVGGSLSATRVRAHEI